MKKLNKKEILSIINIIGQHIEKYWLVAVIILGLVSLFSIGFMIAWYLSPDIVNQNLEIGYYVAQGFLLAISITCIILVLLNRKKIISTNAIAVIFHVYSFILMVWATISFIFDLSLGFPEIIYLLLYTIIAGLFVIDPIFFCGNAILSLIAIIVLAIIKPEMFFDGNFVIENIVNIVAFVLVVITIAFRNYRVTISEFKQAKRLEELSYRDELTGLLNERSYISEVESINNDIKEGKDVKFAVILMDVNNLKATNDAYGHRFGCSLIVRCGHTLPTLFESSKLFHVGGDEFVAIVKGKDYENFEKTMQNFDKALLYSLVEYEGVQLIFSVARGYAIREEGQFYKDVLQIADDEMYKNKKMLKEKYNMKSR